MKRFFETIKHIFAIEELRSRILNTLGYLAIFRLGSFIVLPGIDPSKLSGEATGIFGLLDTFLGGAHQFARKLMDDGAVGRIVSGTAHVMSRGMEHWHPNPDFFFQPGAGPMLDIGPYYVSNLVQLLGPVASVVASANSAHPTRTILSQPRYGEEIPVDTPTTIHAVLTFASGAVVTGIAAVLAYWALKGRKSG